MTWKTIKSWIFIAIPVVMVGALFALRGTLVRVGSENISRLQDEKAATDIADSIRLLYNYTHNRDTGFQYTFLEFGAKGCLSCRKMEGVMKEIKRDFAGQVEVRFLNVSEKEAQEWTKFFGIATIPTQVVLDNTDREVFRHTGFISAEDLGKVLNEGTNCRFYEYIGIFYRIIYDTEVCRLVGLRCFRHGCSKPLGQRR